MCNKKCQSVGKPASAESDCQPHRNQVANEAIDSGKYTECMNCSLCVEENKPCKCDCSDGSLKTTNGSIDVKQPLKANSSFFHSVINMIGMLIGLGQLSIPYALENGGWASAFLLVGLGIICAYSTHLLGKCLDKNPKLRSYTDIGH
ncbi:hypothetical protein Ancab_013980 [Ancistrocladus abbreviatus]